MRNVKSQIERIDLDGWATNNYCLFHCTAKLIPYNFIHFIVHYLNLAIKLS